MITKLMLEDLSHESQFLLASLQETESSQERMQRWIGPDFDWDHLFQMADRHSLTPMVHRSLERLQGGTVPTPVLSHFHAHASKIWARNTILKNQLVTVLQQFQAVHMPVIAYKGPVLAEKLYGHVGLRCFDDLD